MDFYPENYDVTLEVSLDDPVGKPTTVSAVTAKLFDQENAEIVDLGAQSFTSGDRNVSITIPRANLTLGASEVRQARILEVTIVQTNGTIVRRSSFGIQKELRLVIMQNSFQTYEGAEIMSVDFTNVDSWLVADENARKGALEEAFHRITMIPMAYVPRDAENNLLPSERVCIPRDLWQEVTKTTFDAYPAHFKRALRRAQFIEAVSLLRGDDIAQKRRDGIIMEVIGESEVKFETSKVVDYGLSTEALAALTGYIDFSMQIGRA